MANERGSSQVERWFDHIVRAVTVIAIVSGAKMLTDLSSDIKVMNVRIEALSQQVADLRSGVARRYTADDATRDLGNLSAKIADHESRIRDIERQ